MNYQMNGLSYVGPLPSPYPTTAITKTALRKRWTAAERVAAKTWARTDDTAAMLEDDLLSVTYVDLALPDVALSLAYYESIGVLTHARVVAILTDPILDSERPI